VKPLHFAAARNRRSTITQRLGISAPRTVNRQDDGLVFDKWGVPKNVARVTRSGSLRWILASLRHITERLRGLKGTLLPLQHPIVRSSAPAATCPPLRRTGEPLLLAPAPAANLGRLSWVWKGAAHWIK
jgi:hypothetical protein